MSAQTPETETCRRVWRTADERRPVTVMQNVYMKHQCMSLHMWNGTQGAGLNYVGIWPCTRSEALVANIPSTVIKQAGIILSHSWVLNIVAKRRCQIFRFTVKTSGKIQKIIMTKWWCKWASKQPQIMRFHYFHYSNIHNDNSEQQRRPIMFSNKINLNGLFVP